MDKCVLLKTTINRFYFSLNLIGDRINFNIWIMLFQKKKNIILEWLIFYIKKKTWKLIENIQIITDGANIQLIVK